MTFARIGIWKDTPYMVMVTGESLKLSAQERKKINAQTSPTWPHVHARLDCTFKEFLNVFPSNHVLGICGDRLEALNYYCEISGIKPIILGQKGKERIQPVWERVER